jgi:hypothetical protein
LGQTHSLNRHKNQGVLVGSYCSIRNHEGDSGAISVVSAAGEIDTEFACHGVLLKE